MRLKPWCGLNAKKVGWTYRRVNPAQQRIRPRYRRRQPRPKHVMFPQKVCEEVATLCRQETAGRQCASGRHLVTTRYGTENSMGARVWATYPWAAAW